MLSQENRFKPLMQLCKETAWPTYHQWKWWIYTRNEIALKCVKKIGRRYVVDLEAFNSFIENSSLKDPT